MTIVPALVVFPALTMAQNAASDADRRLLDAIRAQKAMADPTPEACRPENHGQGQIVVCGDNEENARQKLPITVPPDTSKTTADGAPRAPNVSGLPDCSKGGCIGFGHVPPPVYYFDIKALPEAPPGSDADKIAKGEMSPP
ncbi:MAG: hypothetical protein KGL48_14230 [Sphingomonadales bacterium]|nr:hypothetical protein [Sphingomonadales bacterium]MDE2570523.1 hypothetical protein [Sphingomonadales bacterium]